MMAAAQRRELLRILLRKEPGTSRASALHMERYSTHQRMSQGYPTRLPLK
jgi:hypothetical protein